MKTVRKSSMKKVVKPTQTSMMTTALKANVSVAALNTFVFAGGESNIIFGALLVSSIILTAKTYLEAAYYERTMFLNV